MCTCSQATPEVRLASWVSNESASNTSRPQRPPALERIKTGRLDHHKVDLVVLPRSATTVGTASPMVAAVGTRKAMTTLNPPGRHAGGALWRARRAARVEPWEAEAAGRAHSGRLARPTYGRGSGESVW